jgi:hypothetical protein
MVSDGRKIRIVSIAIDSNFRRGGWQRISPVRLTCRWKKSFACEFSSRSETPSAGWAVPTHRSDFPARNKNRKAPRETEISIKTAPRGDGFYGISAETLNKNRISIKTASAPPSSCSIFDPPHLSTAASFARAIFFRRVHLSQRRNSEKTEKHREIDYLFQIPRFSDCHSGLVAQRPEGAFCTTNLPARSAPLRLLWRTITRLRKPDSDP